MTIMHVMLVEVEPINNEGRRIITPLMVREAIIFYTKKQHSLVKQFSFRERLEKYLMEASNVST